MQSSLTTIFLPDESVRPHILDVPDGDGRISLWLTGRTEAMSVVVTLFGEQEHIAAFLRQALATVVNHERAIDESH